MSEAWPRTEPAEELRALSFLQPWLYLVLADVRSTLPLVEVGAPPVGKVKPIENRMWKPPLHLIGRRFALHASAGYDPEGQRRAQEIVNDLRDKDLYYEGPTVVPGASSLPRSAILGTARLAGAAHLCGHKGGRWRVSQYVGKLSEKQVETIVTSPWTFGEWAWLLTDVHAFEHHIPARGRLGFWKIPADLAEKVKEEETRHVR
jgi:hypothetical protein